MIMAQFFQSLKAATTCRRLILSTFVTLPGPESESAAIRLRTNCLSRSVRNEALSGASGRIFHMKNESIMGTRPSRMNILNHQLALRIKGSIAKVSYHCQPERFPMPFIFSIANASKPENAPASEAIE
jgi:hypothetical protein